MFKHIFDFLASGTLCSILLILLMILTFLGTLEQTEKGLYEVRQRYFESLVVVHWLFDFIPLVLPGAYTVILLTALNLISGGLIRIRKGIAQWGVVVAHAAVVLLLLGGWIKHHFGEEGYLKLYEGEVSQEYELPLKWEIAVWKWGEDPITEYTIPQKEFLKARQDQPIRFFHPNLPFELVVEQYLEDCFPHRSEDSNTPGAIDGIYLHHATTINPIENRIPGVTVALKTSKGEQITRTHLWGAQTAPETVSIGNETWVIDFRHEKKRLPFSIKLNKFIRELHPRTKLPRAFISEITQIMDGKEYPARIQMNEPLRYKGFALYQASWGPTDAPEGARLYSVLAVSYDPMENLPLYACVILTAGLSFHFLYMLYKKLREAR